MRATSRTQSEASDAGRVPPLEQVRDDIWALAQPMPGEQLPYSFLYLLRDTDDGVHVIDPGSDGDDDWDSFVRALGAIDAAVTDVRTLTATHLHPDHLGMASRIRDASGAILQLHPAEARALATLDEHRPDRARLERQADAWSVPAERRDELLALAVGDAPAAGTSSAERPRPDRLLDDGAVLDIPGFELVALHTPGHTPGHLSLRDDRRGVVFTGDHVLPHLFAGLGLGGPTDTNPLADYLRSIERVAEAGDHEALPGHGYRFSGLGERARESAEHHLARTREVAAIVGRDPATPVWDIATRLTWTAGFAGLRGFTLYSALSQTAMHREFVEGGGLDGLGGTGPIG